MLLHPANLAAYDFVYLAGLDVQTRILLQHLLQLRAGAIPAGTSDYEVVRGVDYCSDDRRLQLSLPQRTADTAVLLALAGAEAYTVGEKDGMTLKAQNRPG